MCRLLLDKIRRHEHLVHELGHALGLLDMGSQKYTIMGSHDLNTVYKPTISDITGVNTIW